MEGVKSMNTVTVDTGSLGPRAVSLLSGYRRLVGAALPYSIPLPAAVALYVVGAAGRPAALAVIAASTAAVLVRVVVEVVRIETQREQADRWIITHTGQPPKDTVLQARLDELLAARLRIGLGAAFRRLADDAALTTRRRDLLSLQPTRRQLRPHVHDVMELADKLSDLNEPVSPRGVALANRLLAEAGGPLHNFQRARELAVTLPQTLRALHD
jgi:hypothetical protein